MLCCIAYDLDRGYIGLPYISIDVPGRSGWRHTSAEDVPIRHDRIGGLRIQGVHITHLDAFADPSVNVLLLRAWIGAYGVHTRS